MHVNWITFAFDLLSPMLALALGHLEKRRHTRHRRFRRSKLKPLQRPQIFGVFFPPQDTEQLIFQYVFFIVYLKWLEEYGKLYLNQTNYSISKLSKLIAKVWSIDWSVVFLLTSFRIQNEAQFWSRSQVASITFNSALAQMSKKPIQAMRILESMRATMPDVAALQRMDQMRNGGRPALKRRGLVVEEVKFACSLEKLGWYDMIQIQSFPTIAPWFETNC